MSPSDLRAARRVLCVQPHYDDNDLGAGGTIAALAQAGARVAYLTVTDDLVGVLDEGLSDAQATEQLRGEQERAGREVGVAEQHWLGFPDAGEWDYFALRRGIIACMRRFAPDLVFTVDPWLRHEAHQDHLRVGLAVAEASMLQRMKRLRLDSDAPDWQPHDISSVAFYFTREPNLCFDIVDTRERKHRAIDSYRAQFSEDQLRLLHLGLEAKERAWAEDESFTYGEALKVLAPGAFHVGL